MRGASPVGQRRHKTLLGGWLKAAGVTAKTPLAEMKAKILQQFLHGDGNDFPGVLALLEKEYQQTASEAKRQKLEAFRDEVQCGACHGARLRPEARAVFFGGKAIHQVTALTVQAAAEFFRGVLPTEPKGTQAMQAIAQPLLSEIAARLAFLDKVGLGYLTLDRPAGTLSGGELQRVRLASGLGSGLVGVCYVLDEPSVGLHPRDNQRLIDALGDLQARGNSVVVVEHDETIMRRADWILDLGPGAGRHGGRIVAQGTPAQVAANSASLTGRYLAGTERIPQPAERRRVTAGHAITLEGARTNNLKDLTVRFPLSALVCVTGVSGSGKSSLLSETLARALVRRLGGVAPKPGPFSSLRGASQIDKVVQVDQSPIGRTPRSNPATYAGLFDEIRKVFAHTREARAGVTRPAASASISRAAAATNARAKGSGRSK